MAKIGTYENAPSPVSADDKLIGTDSVNNDATKNFTVQEIANFVGNNGPFTNWRLVGNSGTNPSTNFIGTTDNQDLVFKRNNTEYLRFKTSAFNDDVLFSKNIKIQGTYSQILVSGSSGYSSLICDNNGGYVSLQNSNGHVGTIRPTNITSPILLEFPDISGTISTTNSVWNLTGNSGANPSTNFIGTLDNNDFVFKTFNVERLRLGASGGINSSTYINVSDGTNSAVVGIGYINLSTPSGTAQFQSGNVSGSKTLQLPNANGELVVSVNNVAPVNGNVTISTALPYKVYSALITQNGASGLTITVLENTLGSISSITYGTNPYYYYLFGSGLFTANKTMVIHGDSALSGGDKLVRIYRGTANTVEVYGYIAGIMDHTAIQSVSLEIRVYP